MDPDQDAALDALVKTKATRYEAPAGLRRRIADGLTRSDAMPASSHGAERAISWRRWLNIGVAFACGVIASVVVTRSFLMSDEQDRCTGGLRAPHEMRAIGFAPRDRGQRKRRECERLTEQRTDLVHAVDIGGEAVDLDPAAGQREHFGLAPAHGGEHAVE